MSHSVVIEQRGCVIYPVHLKFPERHEWSYVINQILPFGKSIGMVSAGFDRGDYHLMIQSPEEYYPGEIIRNLGIKTMQMGSSFTFTPLGYQTEMIGQFPKARANEADDVMYAVAEDMAVQFAFHEDIEVLKVLLKGGEKRKMHTRIKIDLENRIDVRPAPGIFFTTPDKKKQS